MTAEAPTALKKQQNQPDTLAELQAEVAALREELRRAQRLAAVGTMTAIVVHEFNNILTPIINYARMAESNPKMITKAIARASEGGQRATEICQALLGITDEHESNGPTEQSIVEMTGEILTAMARSPGKDGIELTIDVPDGLTIVTRRPEFQQVLLNLLLNARAAVLARPAPRFIGISAEREDGWTVVRVADNGVGIPPKIIDKIFQPFFTTRGGDNNGESRGHGLGLALCREIMDMLSGDITVDSEVGVGTTFELRLPV